jgi:hypothetical protein
MSLPVTTPSEKPVTRPAQPPARPATSPPASPPSTVTRPTLSAGELQKIKEHLAMARFHFERGEYAAAIEEAQGGLRIDPTNAQLRSLAVRAQKAKAAEEKYLQ